MRAREAAAARGRDAAAAAAAIHAENLQELQTLRTPEELAADAAADLHDMITGASASEQAARARAKTRALREKERQQRDHDEKAAKQAKQRASARERMQKLRNNEAFRELEVPCYLDARYSVVRDREVRWFLFAVSERSTTWTGQ
jgi:hypothetical protein